MRELLLYGLSACVSLFTLSYSVHIFVGGLVSQSLEYTIMGIVVTLAISAFSWMVLDVRKSRKNKKNKELP